MELCGQLIFREKSVKNLKTVKFINATTLFCLSMHYVLHINDNINVHINLISLKQAVIFFAHFTDF